MATILLGGYYGAGNVGDEAILAAILADFRALAADLTFTVLSWDPDHTRRVHEVEAVDWRDIGGMVDAAQASDLILVGGGGLFQDHWGLDPGSYLRLDHGGITSYGSLPLLAAWVGVPCMIYGVGIGPLKGNLAREHTRLAAERCQMVCVRDELSSKALEETGFKGINPNGTGVKITADPAFSLSTSAADEETADGILEQHGLSGNVPLLAVNVRYWDQPHPPHEWLPGIAEGLGRFMEDHPALQVVLIPFQDHRESAYTDDKAPCQRLSRSLPEPERVHVLEAVPSPGLCQALLGRCDLVLGMRLHSLILGINQRVPVVGLPYDPKVSALMDEVGLAAYCLPTYNPDPGGLQDILEKAWQDREQIRDQLSEISDEMARRARENATRALELLSAPFQPRRPGWMRWLGRRWMKLRYQVDRLLKGER